MTKSLPAFAPVLLSIILLLASSTGAQQNSEDLLAHELMNNYLDLIRSGNLESALGLWEPKALEQAQRLNIRFENIPIKPDCNSPVMYDYDRVKEFFYNAIQSLAVIDSLAGIRRLRFSLLLGAEKIEYHYYARKIGQNYWLIFPHDYYAENWPVKESKYFRIHINPQQLKYYNERAAARLDDFVENFSIGAMDVDSALSYFSRIPNKAVITGAHRSDIQLAAMETSTKCIILTGGLYTNDVVIGRAQSKGIPIISVAEDTFTAIDRIEATMGKARIREKGKIARAKELIETEFDMKGFLKIIGNRF